MNSRVGVSDPGSETYTLNMWVQKSCTQTMSMQRAPLKLKWKTYIMNVLS